MKDIESREDIEHLMSDFYGAVMQDESIGFLFTEVAKINLEAHLPIICDFWELVLLQGGNYKKDVMAIHLELHEKSPLRKEHFDQWLHLFNQAIDTSFVGLTADKAKVRAQSIAFMMQTKIYRPS